MSEQELRPWAAVFWTLF